MLTLEKVIKVARKLPPEFFIDQLVDKLILLEKIEEALAQGERGEVYTAAEARALLKQWSVSRGRGE